MTIILSALLNLARSSAFRSPGLAEEDEEDSLYTGRIVIFPFRMKETPLVVRTGASSCKVPQADRTLGPRGFLMRRMVQEEDGDQDSRISEEEFRMVIHHPVQEDEAGICSGL